MAETFVGIDVSKDRLDVSERPSGRAWSVGNTTRGIQELCRRLSKLAPLLIVAEASGGYERSAATAMLQAKLPVAVVNAERVRFFAMAEGRRSKTDSIDAAVLALFAERMRPPVRPLRDPVVVALAELNRRRTQLVANLTEEVNRLELAEGGIEEAIRRHVRWLKEEIARLEREMDDRIGGEPELSEKEKILRSAPGIGEVNARLILSSMPELGKLSGRQAAALYGLAPYADDSGRREGVRRIRGGRTEPRNALYMAALAAVKRQGRLREIYLGLVQRGKNAKVALVACMRHLVVALNAMLRDRKPWAESPA